MPTPQVKILEDSIAQKVRVASKIAQISEKCSNAKKDNFYKTLELLLDQEVVKNDAIKAIHSIEIIENRQKKSFLKDYILYKNGDTQALSNLTRKRDIGEIKPYKPNFMGQINQILNSPSLIPQEAIGKFILRILYKITDEAYVYGTNFILGPTRARHLDRRGANRNEIRDAGINTVTSFLPIGKIGKFMKLETKILNAAEFGSKFKGQKVLKGSHSLRGFEIRKYNHATRQFKASESAYKKLNEGMFFLHSDSISHK